MAKVKAEKEARIAEQQAEADRIATQQKAVEDARIAEDKRLVAEKDEADRNAKQKATEEEKRIVAEKSEADRVAKEKAIEENDELLKKKKWKKWPGLQKKSELHLNKQGLQSACLRKRPWRRLELRRSNL